MDILIVWGGRARTRPGVEIKTVAGLRRNLVRPGQCGYWRRRSERPYFGEFNR